MNVTPPNLASPIPNMRQPLSPALRAAFAPTGRVPSEFETLLNTLERGSMRRQRML